MLPFCLIVFYIFGYSIDSYAALLIAEPFTVADAVSAACTYTVYLVITFLDKGIEPGSISQSLFIFITMNVASEIFLASTFFFIRAPTSPPIVQSYHSVAGVSRTFRYHRIIYTIYYIINFIPICIIPFIERFMFEEPFRFKNETAYKQEGFLFLMILLTSASVFWVHAFIIWCLHYHRGVEPHLSHSIDVVLGYLLKLVFLNVYMNDTTSSSAAFASCVLVFMALLIL